MVYFDERVPGQLPATSEVLRRTSPSSLMVLLAQICMWAAYALYYLTSSRHGYNSSTRWCSPHRSMQNKPLLLLVYGLVLGAEFLED